MVFSSFIPPPPKNGENEKKANGENELKTKFESIED
jgi:hypothetical protein